MEHWEGSLLLWQDVFLVVVSLISFFLNVVLLYVNVQRKTKSIDILVISLIALCDGASDLFMVISQLWRLITSDPIASGSIWCYCSVMISRSLMVAAFDLSGLLAVARYYSIVKEEPPDPKRWSFFAILIPCFILTLYGIRSWLSAPIVFPSGMYCTFYWHPTSSLEIFLACITVLLAVPPFIAMPFYYSRINRHYQVLISDLPSFHKNTKRQMRNMLFVVTLFSILILPEFLQSFILVVTGTPPSPWVDACMRILKAFSSIATALFALLVQTEIRQEFRRLSSLPIKRFFDSFS